MGVQLSYPLVQEPESYEDPDFDEDSAQTDFALQIHKINLEFCAEIVHHRIRSVAEQSKFEEFELNWQTKVVELQKQYPDWSNEDILNLKLLFEMFDSNCDCVLDFHEIDKALNEVHDASSEEERRMLFEECAKEEYGSLNFEEFLQLMYTLRQRTGPSRMPANLISNDAGTGEMISIVRRIDTFQQMCYGVF
ncbi:uncharacterized protein [Lepisosteus oculatus]|uniref:uncharacterized protein n=1 Tax=Lepisosteus oculatus TaxID=7918 RepID=UPI0035F50BE8